VSGGEVFAKHEGRGSFDGIRLDDCGRLWAAVGKAVHCYHPDAYYEQRAAHASPLPASERRAGDDEDGHKHQTSQERAGEQQEARRASWLVQRHVPLQLHTDTPTNISPRIQHSQGKIRYRCGDSSSLLDIDKVEGRWRSGYFR
jgi:hypothetical protein